FLLSDGVKNTLKDGLDIFGSTLKALTPAMELFVKGLETANFILKPWLDGFARNTEKKDYYGAGSFPSFVLRRNDSLLKAGFVEDTAALQKLKSAKGFATFF